MANGIDSHVSKAINPAKAVSTAAYLLFYRRRSDHPLGGKELQEITENSVQADSDEQEDGSGFPSGEGRRLVDSSRNGSTSALAGVGATHQAGDGGLRAGPRVKSVEVEGSDEEEEEELPPYEQRMDLESSNFPHDPPAWSFDRLSEGGGNDFDDNDSDSSNKAVGGGDLSDLEQFVEGDNNNTTTTNFHSVTADEDEDLPVVELRVGDNE